MMQSRYSWPLPPFFLTIRFVGEKFFFSGDDDFLADPLEVCFLLAVAPMAAAGEAATRAAMAAAKNGMVALSRWSWNQIKFCEPKLLHFQVGVALFTRVKGRVLLVAGMSFWYCIVIG